MSLSDGVQGLSAANGHQLLLVQRKSTRTTLQAMYLRIPSGATPITSDCGSGRCSNLLDVSNTRTSQFVILPPYQHKGHGGTLGI